MSKRPPNELESKLHQAALAAPKKELTAREIEAIIPDPTARQDALNFLLGVGLLKSLATVRGTLSFRAVTKGELIATKDLGGEENLVLGHIKSSGNEGIWTKHLKAKTNLHQTIIDRCLKTLVQKSLIKRVPSVQHPTRKIYMLFHLDPSIALTGGPWYTDNELDTEFIQNLTDACLKFIRDMTFPKRRGDGKQGALYPISHPPRYPTAQNIKNSLQQARLTETELTVEHVEMLLNVLVLDGEVERIPAFGSTLWDSNAIDDGESSEKQERRSKKKRKHKEVESPDAKKKKTKTKRRTKVESSDDDSDSEKEIRRKKHKRKQSQPTESDSDSEDSTAHKPRKKGKRRRENTQSSSEESDTEKSSSHKRRKKKSRKPVTSSSESESSDTESEDNRRHRKGKSKAKRDLASPTPLELVGGHVYRAVRQEYLDSGWAEAPCSKCPSFDFCKDGGPVNPTHCVYYGDWLASGNVAADQDGL